jgi:hypothetical protein
MLVLVLKYFLFKKVAGVRFLRCSKSSVAVTNVEFELFGEKTTCYRYFFVVIGSVPHSPIRNDSPILLVLAGNREGLVKLKPVPTKGQLAWVL